jgi:hypothetical protein
MRMLKSRIIEHLQPKRPSMISKHFTDTEGHSFADITVLPLHKIPDDTDTAIAEQLLKAAETLWIDRLYTSHGKGLNVVVHDTTTRV